MLNLHAQCTQPCGLNVNNFMFNSFNDDVKVDAQWDSLEETGVYQFKLEFKKVDDENWTGMLNGLDSTATSKTINGLDYNTTYVWRLISFCEANLVSPSDWSVVDTFTTPEFEACPIPDNVYTSDVLCLENEAFAVANWESMLGQGVDHFMLEYKSTAEDDNQWITLSNMDSTVNSTLIGNLPFESNYEWRVRSYCYENQSYFSEWSVRDTFTVGTFVPAIFQPNVSVSVEDSTCAILTTLNITMSQEANEPDIQSSSFTSNGGSFEISSLVTNQEVGTVKAIVGLNLEEYNYTLKVSQILGDNEAVLALNNNSSGFNDSYITILNETNGINLTIISPGGDNNNYTSGNTLNVSFENIFRNPDPMNMEFYNNINSELNDNHQSDENILVECLSINENYNFVEIFPNPTTNFVNINLEGKKYIRIYNHLGGLELLHITSDTRMETSLLSYGVYMLLIEQNGNIYQSKLFIR